MTTLEPVVSARVVGFEVGGAILAGLTGGLVFLVIVWDAIAGGITRMGYLYVLGAGIAPRADRGSAYGLGLAAHVALSAIFGLVYAALLVALGASAVGDAVTFGLLIGLVHGAGAIATTGWVLAHVHPLVGTGELPRPGRMLTGYGRSTPIVWMVAHAAFGMTVGAVYGTAAL